MLDFGTELESLLSALVGAKGDFAVCGGVAVAIHGVPRFTKDIDLLVPSAATEAVLEVARTCGFTLPAGPMDFDAGTARERHIRRISKIGTGQILTLDLIAVEPSFAEVWRSRQQVEWKGHLILVVSREGLGTMKRLSGRPQDRWDLVALGLEDT